MGNVVITSLLIFTFIFFNIRWCICDRDSRNNLTLRCLLSERAALLNFKHNLTYFDKDVSSSWKGEECCEWSRVVCDNTTGHVLKLDLNGDVFNYLLEVQKFKSLVSLFELKQLEKLDLSYNNFSYSSIPRFVGSMRQLTYLNLSSAHIGGLIPVELGNLTHLLILDLYNNAFSGEVPASLGKLANLKELELSYNKLSSIASSLIFPSKLQVLDIGSNPLAGTILTESHFSNLSSLIGLAIDDAMLTLNLSTDWVPPFQVQFLSASGCKINGQFPPWLQTQKNLTVLDLSNANITGLMPRWFHTMQQLYVIYLSNNNLSGTPVFPINFSEIYLGHNFLSWDILSNESKTVVYRIAICIDLTYNFITSIFLKDLVQLMPNMESLYLANNQISGPIPNSMCHLKSLVTIEIQNNSLSGVIPNCWTNISTLEIVQLSYNKLKGRIPCFSYSDFAKYDFPPGFHLLLNDNMLSGEIPLCLTILTNLRILDIGGNQLSGKMSKWVNNAEKFKKLEILRMRGNKFSGTIPRQLCSYPQLRILDLAHNNFSGSIPRCISNLTGMSSPISPNTIEYLPLSEVNEVFQGIEQAYSSTLPYLVDLDLSCNNLVGSIPDGVTKLFGLLSLNLSYNKLSGMIPENIDGLKSLIALDLSKNKLSGSIPTSMGELYSLSHLNLSYNNLSGQIPTGNQLQTLSNQASIYAGNPYLCADFLPRKCKSKTGELGKGTSYKGNADNREKKLKKMGFELVVMSGFATGFWGVVGCLVLNRRWRDAFFLRLEDGYNWLYVRVVLKARVLKAKMKRGE